jgi:hypothetical protein
LVFAARTSGHDFGELAEPPPRTELHERVGEGPGEAVDADRQDLEGVVHARLQR